jgi:tetratricopeptide (TPR) repeat protein
METAAPAMNGGWRRGSGIPAMAKLAGAAALAAMLLGATGCAKLQARDQLNKGVQAYKASQFEQAVEHFKNANQLDPNLTVAKLYLATACVAQYVPGGDSPNNLQLANCAIDEYKVVLEADKGNKNTKLLSLKGLASLYFNMKKFDEAKEYDLKAIEADPNDPENYYSVAVIDWTQSYVPRMEARGKLGLKLDEPIKDKKVCQEIKEKNQDRVKDGIEMLQKAISLRKDYDDAMAYLNLMYRERADIQCGDPEARAADLKLADDMVEQTMDVKKAKAEKAKEQHGIVLDTK